MIKTLVIAASVATAAIATPAMANNIKQDDSSVTVSSPNNFGGVYGELTAGYDDVTGMRDTTNVTYGTSIGINIPVGRVIVGAEANVDNVFDRRDIGASARLGYAFDRVMPYAKVGYANYNDALSRKLDGLRVGGGLEYNLSSHTYIKAEYRYTNFEKRVGKHAVLGGVGIRF